MRELFKLVAAAIVVAVATLGFAATAGAKDRNRDGLPDRWEKRHGLSLKVKQGRRDQDKDGFTNRAEFRATTDPRDADSDEDGIEDDDENAGTISSFDAGVLTVTLFAGGELTAKVTSKTEVECRKAGEVEKGERGDDDDGEHGDKDDDDHGEGGDDDELGEDDDARASSGGDRDEQDEDDDDRDASCSADALKVGTVVHEAELGANGAGAFWQELELLVP